MSFVGNWGKSYGSDFVITLWVFGGVMVAKISARARFKIGDKAVYPGKGVGIIERIEDREISGNKATFYIFKVLDNNSTIMVPTANQSVLRPVISTEDVKKVYRTLKQKNVKLNTETWNRRYRAYKDKIKEGKILNVAEVLRDLYLLKNTKTLSFGEKKMLEEAKGLLIKELSLAQQTPEAKVMGQLEKIFHA